MEKHARDRMLGSAEAPRDRPPLKPRLKSATEEKEASEIINPPPVGARGIICPRCKSARHYVWKSVPAGTFRKRYRACQDCGNRFETEERVQP